MGDVGGALCRRVAIEKLADGGADRLAAAGVFLAEQLLQFGEHLFVRFEIRGVFRLLYQLGAGLAVGCP